MPAQEPVYIKHDIATGAIEINHTMVRTMSVPYPFCVRYYKIRTLSATWPNKVYHVA
jgi:hypothetical protein